MCVKEGVGEGVREKESGERGDATVEMVGEEVTWKEGVWLSLYPYMQATARRRRRFPLDAASSLMGAADEEAMRPSSSMSKAKRQKLKRNY